MRILLVGSNYSWSIENYFIKYFSEMGLKIELFPAQTQFYNYYYSSLINKIKFRLGLSRIINNINKELLVHINSFQPKIIFIFNFYRYCLIFDLQCYTSGLLNGFYYFSR